MKQPELVTINPSDFYYDDGDGEPMFYEDAALAWLIMQDGPVYLLGAKDHEGKETIGVYVNCSDVFAWGCADCEPLPMSDLENFLKLYLSHPSGATKWCCLRRNEQPQPPVKRGMIERGDWDDELEILPKNTMDREVHESLGIKYPDQA
jgi:hypothetical protein